MIGALLAMAAAASPSVAVEVRRFPAAEAHQGVAAGAHSVYAIDNSTVARYDKASGRRVMVWKGDPVRFQHINSCIVRAQQLVCAASNYPDTPMASKVLWLDAATLKLVRVRDLGHGFGSLTWLDRHHGSWWACFANYDGNGGEPGRDHRSTVLVRYGPDFGWQATYRFPSSVLARFAPRSSSGGAWGRDGLLYVTGHDRAELYALRLPHRGRILEEVVTIVTPTGGQAIGWDGREPRLLWSIDRATSELVASRISKIRRRGSPLPVHRRSERRN